MGGACSTYGGGFWWENHRERCHLKYLGVDGRIILRWIFRKWDCRGMECIDLAQDRIGTGGDSEPSGSIKCGEFLD
jgi:hypothetical protein